MWQVQVLFFVLCAAPAVAVETLPTAPTTAAENEEAVSVEINQFGDTRLIRSGRSSSEPQAAALVRVEASPDATEKPSRDFRARLPKHAHQRVRDRRLAALKRENQGQDQGNKATVSASKPMPNYYDLMQVWNADGKPPKTANGDGGGDGGESIPIFGGAPRLVSDNETVPGPCGSLLVSPTGKCPDECPFFDDAPGLEYFGVHLPQAELGNRTLEWNCAFRCVASGQCGLNSSGRQFVEDADLGICRHCRVGGCEECVHGKDECIKCKTGWVFDPETKTCYSGQKIYWSCLLGVVFLLVCFVILWYLDLRLRPSSNPAGVKEALDFRSRLRALMPPGTPPGTGTEARGTPYQLYPICINLMKENIFGPGTILFFNYQMALIIWAFFMVLGWYLTGTLMKPELFRIGIIPAPTPMEMCHVIHWGHEHQLDAMRAKCAFLFFAYLWTFLFCLFYSIRSARCHSELDVEVTMKDFTALASGLPNFTGSDNAEQLVKDFITEKTGQTVVGVSIGWDYSEQTEEVGRELERVMTELERERPAPVLEGEEEEPMPENPAGLTGGPQCFKGPFSWIDGMAGFDAEATAAAEEEGTVEQQVTELKAALLAMKSSEHAFVVFETERMRDIAVEEMENGMAFEGGGYQSQKVTLAVEDVEPPHVRWDHLKVNPEPVVPALIASAFKMVLVMVVYAFVFYLPNAYYSLAFSYANGEQPDATNALVVSLVVTAGNNVMYFAADTFSQGIDFKFNDHREATNMVLYSIASILNVVLDMFLTGFVTYDQMVAQHVKTSDGRLLEDLPNLLQIFESYPMQKALGNALWLYCYPATFLTPFVIEPIATILTPAHMLTHLVRTHPEVRGRKAELGVPYFVPFDLTRYGDVNLNVLLAVLVFFFPGGYTMCMFVALFKCHIAIYLYDHFRVLRLVPKFSFANTATDMVGQYLMIPPTALLLTCLVYKMHFLMSEEPPSDKIYGYCMWAFLLHAMVHWILLLHLPYWGTVPHRPSKVPYAKAAATEPCTFFTQNPVHCLRSLHVHGHSPPVDYYVLGKDYTMRSNPEVNTFYDGQNAASA